MARSIRIQFSGALYHIMSRGNAKQDIFLSDKDRVLFLDVLGDVVEKYNLICHSYCLMDNHYHLLIETPDANLADAMRRLNSDYSQKFNKRNTRVGHVLQGRYKSILVEKDTYLQEVSRYIDLNPVRAGLVGEPSEWQWSSYAQSIGKRKGVAWLKTGYLLGRFGTDSVSARRKYARFVLEGIGKDGPFVNLRDPLVLGLEEYVGYVYTQASDTTECIYAPSKARFVDRPSLDEIFCDVVDKKDRNLCIHIARVQCGYKISKIAKYLGLHRTTVSHILKKPDIPRSDPN